MKRALRIALCVAALALAGCSSQIVNVPINPYVDSALPSRRIGAVAVLPFVVPEYLQFKDGAEAVSVDATNRFIEELARDGVYRQVDGAKVRDAIAASYPTPRDWIFKGTQAEAARIARQVGADAAVFGRITKYIHGNLTDSEFEMEVTCVDTSGNVRLWTVRQTVIGRGGKRWLAEPDIAPSPAVLSEHASVAAADQVARIQAAGGPIDVVGTSHRRAWGYGVLAGGVVMTAAGGYFFAMSEDSYGRYRDADTDVDLARYKKQTEEYDNAWQITGGLGVAAIGTGLYLILTDQTMRSADAEPTRRFAWSPAMIAPDAQGVMAVWRFR